MGSIFSILGGPATAVEPGDGALDDPTIQCEADCIV
jgi:hypothetical protein